MNRQSLLLVDWLKNSVKTILLLQETFKNDSVGVPTFRRWHKMFLVGIVRGVETAGLEAKNCMHSDEYQYHRGCHQRRPSSVSTIDWLNDWSKDRVIKWLNEWFSEWLIQWMNEWMNEWMKEWMIDCLIDWLID